MGCLAVFFSIFLLAGLAAFYALFARPVWRVVEARSWQETPCEVVSSGVSTSEGGDGASATYGIDAVLSYTVAGARYTTTRYSFSDIRTSGYAGKSAIIAELPPGKKTVCYVNPANPAEAVLNREFRVEYLLGLMPLVFVAVGGGGMAWALRAARRPVRPPSKAATWLPPSARPAAEEPSSDAPSPSAEVEEPVHGPVRLKAKGGGPIGKFLGVTFIALFWNGIVGVFVWQAVEGWRTGSPSWFLTLFLVPFVLIGLGLIFGIGYQFLAIFNPRPTITISRAVVPLGGSVSLDWSLSGMASRVQRLRIFLEGREEATYRRGTSSYTDKETFATLEIVDTTSTLVAEPAGRASFQVPETTMHTFTADHNKILWSLKVAGEIPGWPDIQEEFEIVVTPDDGGVGGRS